MLGQPWHLEGISFKTDGFPRVWFLFVAIIIWSSAVLLNSIPALLLQSLLLHLLPAKSGDALFDTLISLAKKLPLQNYLPLVTGVQTTNQGSEVLIISSSTTVWIFWAQTRSSASTIPQRVRRKLLHRAQQQFPPSSEVVQFPLKASLFSTLTHSEPAAGAAVVSGFLWDSWRWLRSKLNTRSTESFWEIFSSLLSAQQGIMHGAAISLNFPSFCSVFPQDPQEEKLRLPNCIPPFEVLHGH